MKKKRSDPAQSKNKVIKVALIGNPNVGKSTLFNSLTGLHQHTGNWSGKTVGIACGKVKSKVNSYLLYDLPGTYSLTPNSSEEECSRDSVLFDPYDAVIAVCDCARIERNLFLVLELMQVCKNLIVCLNLCREGECSGVFIDKKQLSLSLGVPVIKIDAKSRSSVKTVLRVLDESIKSPCENNTDHFPVLSDENRDAVSKGMDILSKTRLTCSAKAFIITSYLCGDEKLIRTLDKKLGLKMTKSTDISSLYSEFKDKREALFDDYSSKIYSKVSQICRCCVSHEQNKKATLTKRADAILTGKLTAFPIMLCLLIFLLWLTVAGANVISDALASVLFMAEKPMLTFLLNIKLPSEIAECMVFGVYRMLAWVVSVMLPPMAIFFPLFTLLEDIGYLPRIAYCLDRPFMKCSACGKQSLTMCMGLGCNAAGVVGCRIIDSERERMLALVTNSFIPCNGKIPALTTICALFFTFGKGAAASFSLSAVILCLLIFLSVAMTFAFTKILSKTILSGLPSSFILEMPPFRAPKIMQILTRSFIDRTLKVLFRAVYVAAPAGLAVYLLANIHTGETNLLCSIAAFLDPIANIIGLDGIILISFMLGICANETIIPIMLMAYTQGSSLSHFQNMDTIRDLLLQSGWSMKTAVCFIILMLFHLPCSTTLLTIKKESGSTFYTLLSALMPLLLGITLCFVINLISLVL